MPEMQGRAVQPRTTYGPVWAISHHRMLGRHLPMHQAAPAHLFTSHTRQSRRWTEKWLYTYDGGWASHTRWNDLMMDTIDMYSIYWIKVFSTWVCIYIFLHACMYKYVVYFFSVWICTMKYDSEVVVRTNGMPDICNTWRGIHTHTTYAAFNHVAMCS